MLPPSFAHLDVRQFHYSTMQHISIPLGIVIGLLASFVQSLGLTIQRKSHVLNQILPENEQRVGHRRPLWLLGFVIFISSNLFGSLVQIASLPVVILAPLGAVSLLWNALFARIILGDVFSPWMVLGTVLIAGGAVLIAIFGIVPEPERSLEDLLALLSRGDFVIYFGCLSAGVFLCVVITHFVQYSMSGEPAKVVRRVSTVTGPSASSHSLIDVPLPSGTSERTPLLVKKSRSSIFSVSASGTVGSGIYESGTTRTRLLVAISYASISGIISGMCLVFAKSGVELLLLTVKGKSQFWRWQTWILLIGLGTFALLQLWYLHKALILADPTLVCPSAFCFYNLSSIVNGLVYFDQFSLIAPVHLALVGLGIVTLLSGVWVVSVQSGGKEVDVEGWNDIEEEVNGVAETEQEGTVDGLPNPEQTGEARRVGLAAVEEEPPTSGGPGLAKKALRGLRGLRRKTAQGIGLGPPPVVPVGPGLQIGLSAVSPGFAIVPQERGRRVSGLGIADSVLDAREEARRRRRTVSEGDLRRDGEGTRTVVGKRMAGARRARWKWFKWIW